MANKVIADNADFMAAWEKKKKANASLHKKAIAKIKNMCGFSNNSQ